MDKTMTSGEIERLRADLTLRNRDLDGATRRLGYLEAQLAVMREALEQAQAYVSVEAGADPLGLSCLDKIMNALTPDAGKAAADVLAAAKLVADHDGGGNTWHTLKEAIYRAYRGEQ